MSASSTARRLDERGTLLIRVWDLEMRAESEQLRILLEALPRAVLIEEPELGAGLLSTYLFTLAAEKAQELERDLQPTFEDRGNDRLHRRFINMQGILAMRQSAYSRAEHSFRRVEWMSNAARDEVTLCWALSNLGSVEMFRFHGSEALAHFARALVLARAQRDSRIIASIFYGTGIAYRDLGMYAEAQRDFDLARRHQRNAHELAYIDIDEGDLLVQMGRTETASLLARRAREAFQALGGQIGVADASRVMAMVATKLGDLDAARAEIDHARSAFPGTDTFLDAQIEEERAVIATLAGDDETRVQAEERAVALYLAVESPGRAERMRRRLALARASG